MGVTNRMSHLLALSMLAVVSACTEPSESDRLNAARGHLAKRDGAAAAMELKSVLQTNPEQGEARFLLGRQLLQAGDAAAAEAEFQRAMSAGYDKEQVIPMLAKALTAQEKYGALVSQFETTVLSDAAAAADLLAQLAGAYLAAGSVEQAQGVISQALQRVPGHPQATLMHARLKAVQGDVPAGLSEVSALLARDPNLADAWLLKGDLLRPVAGSNFDPAIDAYRKAIDKQPDLLPAYAALLNLLLLKREFGMADTVLAAMRKAAPKQALVTYFDAVLALQQGNAKRSLELSQQLLRGASDNAAVLMLAARAELQLNALEQAEADAAKAVQAAPSASLPRHLHAEILLRNGKGDKALAVLRPLLDSKTPDAQTLSLAGQARLLNGDAKSAQALLERASKAQPDNLRIRTARALANLNSSAAPTVFSELESIAKADADTAADMALISAHLSRNEFDSAARAIDNLAAKTPKLALADMLRARTALLRRDPAQARKHFDVARAKQPNLLAPVTGLALLDLADKNPGAARARLEAFIEAVPSDGDARLALADLVGRTGGSAEEVNALLTSAVKAKPSDATIRLALIDQLLSRGESKAALSAAQDGLAALPGNLQLLDRLGQLQQAAGDVSQAQSTYVKWAQLQPAAAAPHLHLAELALDNGNPSAAATHVRRALELEPDSLPVQRLAVVVALRESQFARALAMARTVQAQRPTDAVGHLLEGEIELSQAHFELAATAFRNAIGKAGGEEAAMRLHLALTKGGDKAGADRLVANWRRDHPTDMGFVFNLGDQAMAAQDWASAEAHFRMVLARHPDSVMALNNTALALAQQKKSGASEMAERALKLAPNTPTLMDTLATCYASEGQLDKALAMQIQAVGLVPNSPTFRLNLAKLQVQLGSKAEARAELDKLARLGRAFSDQAEVARLQGMVGSAPVDLPTQSPAGTQSVPSGNLEGLKNAGLVGGMLALLAVPLVLLFAALRPPKYLIKRSITVHAPVRQVFALLNDLHQWRQWSLLKQFNPAMKHSFLSGQNSPGAVYNWKDEQKAIEGSLEIVHALAPSQLVVESAITQPNEFRQWYEFSLASDPAGASIVTCTSRGEAPFPMRLAGLLRGGLDRHIGKELNANLVRLKAAAEASQTHQDLPVAADGQPARA